MSNSSINHFIPYGKQSIDNEDILSVVEVLNSDFITQGPIVEIFSKEISKKVNCKYSVPTNSATSALQIAYLSLGLSKGDSLWTSPNTFVATTNAALHCGASVDFIDIDPKTFNISIEKLEKKLSIAKKNNNLPKIISCVHFAGQSCLMEDIYKLSLIYKFKIVEDASHAIGATYKGHKVGSCKFSDICIFSFHPVKIITTGEGGVATTNNHKLAKSMQLLVSHGVQKGNIKFDKEKVNEIWNYEQLKLGFNYRITDIQAALGLSQLKKLDIFLKKRNQIAKKYDSELKNLPIKIPYLHQDNYSSYHLYPIRLPLENKKITQRYFYDSLRKEKILVNLHYIPVYRHTYYRNLGFKKNYCPESEKYFKEVISLPIYASLKEEDQDFIINKIKSIFK